jgi:hypothetical protein
VKRILGNLLTNLICLLLLLEIWNSGLWVIFKISLSLFIPLLLCVTPYFVSIIALLSAVDVDVKEVLYHCRSNVWLTAPEIAKLLQEQKSARVAPLDVAKHLWALENSSTVEGRERYPPEPSMLGKGCIWEYRRNIN